MSRTSSNSSTNITYARSPPSVYWWHAMPLPQQLRWWSRAPGALHRRRHSINFRSNSRFEFSMFLSSTRSRAWLTSPSTNWLVGAKNLGQFSRREWTLLFTPVNRRWFCSSGILSASIFGQWGLFHSPAVSTRR